MVIEPVHCGSSSILKVHFLGHPVEADLIKVVTKCSSIFTLGRQNFGLDFETVLGQDLERDDLQAEVWPN